MLQDFTNTITLSDIVVDTNSSAIDLENAKTISIQCVIDVDTPSNQNFLAGESESNTVTFETQANSDDGDFVVVTDTDGLEWAVAIDKTGSSPEPTASEWTSIPAGRKDQADISGDTTAADVAARFETAFDGLSGFTAVVTTDDTAADGTMLFTHVARGPVTNIATYQDDGAASDISVAETNAGVASTVDTSADTITITSHGYTTGLHVQASSTGTLPSGLSTSTDYYVIVVDANTIQLASSRANALAGTQINITDQGTDGETHTIEVQALASADVSLEMTNSPTTPDSNTNWTTVISATSISADGTVWIEDTDPTGKWARLSFDIASGSMSTTNYLVVKRNNR